MRFLSLTALVCAGAFAQAPAAISAFSGIEEAVAQLSKITGMRPVKKVQADTITKAQFKIYLEETIKDQVKPEEVRAQELALKKLGLVPQDFELMASTVDLLTEQAAAFYDYRRKKLFVMEGGDKASQPVLVVHELAHALADQHFDLGRFIRRGKTDDASMARMAVMEGQATWLMMESAAQKMGLSLKTMPGMADSMSGASDEFTGQYPLLSSAPLYIRASLLFPYKAGFKFQQALVQKLGDAAFLKVFKEPPVSSQQILHPELYLSGMQPADPLVPPLANAQDYKEVVAGSVGEFDHAILIEQYASKAEAAVIAPAWRGGNMALLEHKRDKNVVMVYVSEWQDEAAARKMFDVYRTVLKGKWKNLKVDSDSKSSISGSGDDGAFHVWVQGKRLFSAEGMKSIADLKDLTLGVDAKAPNRAVAASIN
jgi:hypothetical protein